MLMLSQIQADSVVAGRYTLERCINVSGIESLWRARDEQTGGSCELRLADGTGHDLFELVARYRAEAEIIERIRCENVLDVLDYGDWNAIPYLVSEHVEGEDLAARLRRDGHLLPEVAYRLLAQTARALARAHAVGIVHGDITPEHILIANEDTQSIAKIYNFSVTQRTLDCAVGTITRSGSFLRLPYYSSPELTAGKLPDWRSDLWSLGVLAFECLTGKRPFDSNVFGDLVALILCEPIPPLKLPGAETPAELQVWWEKACARDPELRFQSAKEMSDALGQVFGFPIVFVPDGVPGRVGSATSHVPAVMQEATEESRTIRCSDSKRKMGRHSTQMGLGGGNENKPTPVTARLVVENSRVDATASASESVDLEDDLFEGFPVSEAPTLALHRKKPQALAGDETPENVVAVRAERTKFLRKTVFWGIVVLVASISLPLVRVAITGKHKQAAKSSTNAIVAAERKKAQELGSRPSANVESPVGLPGTSAVTSAPPTVSGEADSKHELPNSVETLSSLADAVAKQTVPVAKVDERKAAVKHAANAPESRRNKTTARTNSRAALPPSAVRVKPVPSDTPIAAPQPARPKGEAAARDYGI
jgi:serine/threonine-protein kinase